MKKCINSKNDDMPLPCLDRQHDPPMHLYIPPGKRYVHICPSCKRKIVLNGLSIFC